TDRLSRDGRRPCARYHRLEAAVGHAREGRARSTRVQRWYDREAGDLGRFQHPLGGRGGDAGACERGALTVGGRVAAKGEQRTAEQRYATCCSLFTAHRSRPSPLYA